MKKAVKKTIIKKEKELPEERYDEKLFKQAYKAAQSAKENEKRIAKRKKLLTLVYVFLGILALPSLIWTYIYFQPERYEYIEPIGTSAKSNFETVEAPPLISENSLLISTSNITAQSAIVFNPDNGDIFFSKEIGKQRSVASITKLISALVILDSFDMEESIEVSLENIPEELDWILELEEGSTLVMKDALEAMLISSYNDVAYVVANAYPNGGYPAFINAMNRKAYQLGMNDSHFSNPAGIDDTQNYSTAKDVAKLISAVLNHEKILEIAKKGSAIVSWTDKSGEVESKTIYTTNQLYGVNQYIQGLKTGYTKEASQCFVGYFVYQNGKRIVTVVLGSQDRFNDTKVLEWSVRNILK